MTSLQSILQEGGGWCLNPPTIPSHGKRAHPSIGLKRPSFPLNTLVTTMTDRAVTEATPFAPDWVSPPGNTIINLVDDREWTQAQLAERLGHSLKHVNQLIKG
jgi:hypothetical protein